MRQITIIIAGIAIAIPSSDVACAAESSHDESSQHAEQPNGAHAEHAGNTQHAQHAGASPGIHLEKGQAESMGIRIDKVPAGSARLLIHRPASVRFDPDRTAKVGPRISAKVVNVLKDLGETVSKGEPLAVMNSVELGKAKARFLTTKAKVETAKADFEREKGLFKKRSPVRRPCWMPRRATVKRRPPIRQRAKSIVCMEWRKTLSIRLRPVPRSRSPTFG